jgi:hypothetical protein
MVVRSVALLVIMLAGFAGYSQEKKKTVRPDIPGNILVEFGFNQKSGATPPDFQKSFWGSRTINFYYQYPIRIMKSNFSLIPGVGLSLERWKFSNNYTLPYQPDANGAYQLVNANTIFPTGNINRSFLVNNYVEAPIEIRYDTNPEDIARSFNVSFGARFGVLYDSFMKVDYTENGEDKSNKDKQWHGMNQTRMGFYGRVGIGGFGLFTYFNQTPMFQTNKGPNNTPMSSWTFGISVNGF